MLPSTARIREVGDNVAATVVLACQKAMATAAGGAKPLVKTPAIFLWRTAMSEMVGISVAAFC